MMNMVKDDGLLLICEWCGKIGNCKSGCDGLFDAMHNSEWSYFIVTFESVSGDLHDWVLSKDRKAICDECWAKLVEAMKGGD